MPNVLLSLEQVIAKQIRNLYGILLLSLSIYRYIYNITL